MINIEVGWRRDGDVNGGDKEIKIAMWQIC